MADPYLCPNCKSNHTRFNMIEQVARPVKLDPTSGEIVNEYSNGMVDKFHITYKGPTIKVQCGVCGLIEDERSFIKFAEYNKK